MSEKTGGRENVDFSNEVVPRAVFEELRRAYGTGEPCKVQNHLVFMLDTEKVGFEGSVGLVTSKRNSTLMVWNGDPRDTECSCDVRCLFSICAYVNSIEEFQHPKSMAGCELKFKLFGGEFTVPGSVVSPFILNVALRVDEMVRKESFLPGLVFTLR